MKPSFLVWLSQLLVLCVVFRWLLLVLFPCYEYLFFSDLLFLIATMVYSPCFLKVLLDLESFIFLNQFDKRNDLTSLLPCFEVFIIYISKKKFGLKQQIGFFDYMLYMCFEYLNSLIYIPRYI